MSFYKPTIQGQRDMTPLTDSQMDEASNACHAEQSQEPYFIVDSDESPEQPAVVRVQKKIKKRKVKLYYYC